MSKTYIAQGYQAVIPALAIAGADKAIQWYQDVFGATEKMKFTDSDGKVVHGEIQLEDCVIMVSEENLQYNKSPKTLGGNSVNLCVYVKDVDAVLQNAVDKGATLIMPAEDQFYGDRSGRIQDPFGYIWVISTHVRDVSEEEMKEFMEQSNS